MHEDGDDVARVRDAYERLIAAFAAADTDAYFGCFHEDATFIFPGEAFVGSLAAYRSVWAGWEQEGVRFEDVAIDDVQIRVFGTTAIVTHRIDTMVTAAGASTVDRERETLVFSEIGGRWLGVHEHLSTAPDA